MKNSDKTNYENKEIFVRNLKRYLTNSGKTQKEVANAIKVTPSSVCDWVNGRAYPRIETIQALANYFGINKSDLVEDVNVVKEVVSDADQKVLDLFHKVPEEKREFVLSLIQATIDNL